jgi:hypothetical protein
MKFVTYEEKAYNLLSRLHTKQGILTMPPATLPPNEPTTTSQDISRRKLLKMLTAAGAGASATVLLSSQWVKPVAAGGKLAPHAQVSQPTTHQFVSAIAQQIVDQQTFTSTLRTSCLIAPGDSNIPIVAMVYADIPTSTLAPAVQTLLTTLNANTDATGTATFADTELDINCQNVPAGSTTVTVVFTFANDPADGSGNLTATTLWEFGC